MRQPLDVIRQGALFVKHLEQRLGVGIGILGVRLNAYAHQGSTAERHPHPRANGWWGTGDRNGVVERLRQGNGNGNANDEHISTAYSNKPRSLPFGLLN